jgi:TatD DNase family protein
MVPPRDRAGGEGGSSLIDTHAHLDAFDGDVTDVLARAREAGVTKVIAVGTNIESARRTLAVCEEEGIFAALGLHPHEAGSAGGGDLGELRTMLAHEKVVAVGETGLDHFRDYAPRDAQLRVFRAQAELAVELGKALVVHTRAADAETVAVLADLPAEVPVVLHCFSSPALLDSALEHGWYVSFAGNVTYPKAGDLREAATRVPAERLLAETDSPYLAPQSVRGRRNEPAHVVHTLAALAEARGEAHEGLERQIDENATRAFGLP